MGLAFSILSGKTEPMAFSRIEELCDRIMAALLVFNPDAIPTPVWLNTYVLCGSFVVPRIL
jgi:hypothetical protein